MAANDYHIIVYQILEYLYQCLKDDVEVNPHRLEKFKEDNGLNERYWQYIWTHLLKGELIGTFMTSDCCITPQGIDYLMENTSMQKAGKYTFENKLLALEPLE